MRRASPTSRAPLCAATLLIPLALVVGCSTTTPPPKPDETARRPANQAHAIELQACRNELHNTRLMASESTRLAEATTAALHQLSLSQGAAFRADTLAAAGSPSASATSAVYTFGFDNNSTQLNVPEEASMALVVDARNAALIVIRGRTDATSDAPMNAKAARERAEAARDLLTAAGIDTKRIRVTWQGFGDHVADNGTAEGKALNRRVEIELYRRAPVLMATAGRSGTPVGLAAPSAAGAAAKDLQAATTRPGASAP